MSTPRLAHNVFFKLKDASPAKVQELIDACKKYLNVQAGIVFFAAGALCEELTRDVNDRDWHVGLHLVFVDKAAHDAYQDDPTHEKFIAENKANWAAVRVFDSLV
ncbi:MAG: Dabb family protein [Gemmataceae bacterium]|nr:Dabb family protein [Gemmataceae bacterium]